MYRRAAGGVPLRRARRVAGRRRAAHLPRLHVHDADPLRRRVQGDQGDGVRGVAAPRHALARDALHRRGAEGGRAHPDQDLRRVPADARRRAGERARRRRALLAVRRAPADHHQGEDAPPVHERGGGRRRGGRGRRRRRRRRRERRAGGARHDQRRGARPGARLRSGGGRGGAPLARPRPRPRRHPKEEGDPPRLDFRRRADLLARPRPATVDAPQHRRSAAAPPPRGHSGARRRRRCRRTAPAKKKKKKEKKHKTHPHLADLTHLSATKFVKFTAEPGQLCSPYEMSSFGEKKALKLLRLKQKDDDGDDAAADDDVAPAAAKEKSRRQSSSRGGKGGKKEKDRTKEGHPHAPLFAEPGKVPHGAAATQFGAWQAHNRRQLSRIYPKGTRVASTNLDPLPPGARARRWSPPTTRRGTSRCSSTAPSSTRRRPWLRPQASRDARRLRRRRRASAVAAAP